METKTYRSNSTWFLHHLDPVLRNNFSCRFKSTEKPILAVTDLSSEWLEEDYFCDAPCWSVHGPFLVEQVEVNLKLSGVVHAYVDQKIMR